MIRFRCDCSCGQFLSVPDEFAGRPMLCPNSAGRIRVPRARLTEVAWLRSIDMQGMLQLLPSTPSPRKQRLVAVACCRRIWHLLDSAFSRRAVEVVERVAEGLAAEQELELTLQEMRRMHNWSLTIGRGWFDVGYQAARDSWPASAADRSVRKVAASGGSGAEEGAAQSQLLRDIVGNPFRPAPALDPGWLAWQDGTVRQLSRKAYSHRRLPEGILQPAHLSLLADALEDAGCTDPDLLGHLRGTGPHVRGCWAVDLVLGKS
jgi:hypothetical protein